MSAALIHRLTPAADLRHCTVVCGTADVAVATWIAAQVTCPACVRPACPCGPGVPGCPAGAQWNRQHGRGRPTHLPALRTEQAFQAWLDALGQVRQVETFLWYPGHVDRILEVLYVR